MVMSLTLPVGARRWGIVVITVTVAVMSDMKSMALRLLQSIANTHRSRVGGVQQEHDDEKKSEASAHGV